MVETKKVIDITRQLKKYFQKEIKPHKDDSWVDLTKNKVGYEISFNKEFYVNENLRSTSKILEDIKNLNNEIQKDLMELS